LFAADCAEHVLHVFEQRFSDDPRPRQAIETAHAFALGTASKEDLEKACRNATAAAIAAAGTAATAAYGGAIAARALVASQRVAFDGAFAAATAAAYAAAGAGA